MRLELVLKSRRFYSILAAKLFCAFELTCPWPHSCSKWPSMSYSPLISVTEMDHGSEDFYSEHEEEPLDGDSYSSESDYEDEPALVNSAAMLSKKQSRPHFFSERRESGRSKSGKGYYEKDEKTLGVGQLPTVLVMREHQLEGLSRILGTLEGLVM